MIEHYFSFSESVPSYVLFSDPFLYQLNTRLDHGSKGSFHSIFAFLHVDKSLRQASFQQLEMT